MSLNIKREKHDDGSEDSLIVNFNPDKPTTTNDALEAGPSELFVAGAFQSHSGLNLPYEIRCSALSDEMVEQFARQIIASCAPFDLVVGIPTGGLRLARTMNQLADPRGGDWVIHKVLIVDDVLTTGMSMESEKAKWVGRAKEVKGAVIFARGICPNWITPLWVTQDALAALAAEHQEAREEVTREVERLVEAARIFGARVMERVPDWFEETEGTTDFSEANAELKRALAPYQD